MKKIATYTLGCKVNKYDTEAIINTFLQNGYEEVDSSEFADVFLINTCSVTNLSEKKSRQLIRKARKENENAIVVAFGCYAQVKPSDIEDIEGVNIIVGTKNRGDIYDLVTNYSPSMGVVNTVTDIFKERDFEPLSVTNFSNMTRAYVKIQEGCNQFCTYCIIPYARGTIRSRKPLDVIDEVTLLAKNGIKEIILTGIHVASYGKDLDDMDLLKIIKEVHTIDGIEHIRFSSVEPNLLTEHFISEIKKLPKICDYFHLSLQSGCDKTLKNMNRKYTAEEFLTSVNLLRKYYDNPSLSTDVIVGFPMENDTDFLESYEFCKKVGFSKIHVFPYSAKKGTKAYDFKEQVPTETKEARAKQLRNLSDEMAKEYNDLFLDKEVLVLTESLDSGDFVGHTPNYLNVVIKNSEGLSKNEIVKCKILETTSEKCFATIA